MRPIPQQALDMVERFEGVSLKRYIDADGHPTIGYGHECKPNDGLEELTEDQAMLLLRKDLFNAALAVTRLTSVQLNDNQYSALIDFVFNLGSGVYQASTLRRTINRHDFQDTPKQFNRWVYGGNVKLPGLITRRKAEADLFLL